MNDLNKTIQQHLLSMLNFDNITTYKLYTSVFTKEEVDKILKKSKYDVLKYYKSQGYKHKNTEL